MYLESEEESQVLTDSQSIKQDVVLRTNTKTLANLVHTSENTVPVNGG